MPDPHLILPADWPTSLGFLIAAAIVVLLQAIPYTGIFLMFVGAMFWSILLVNAAMIGIAWEVWDGQVAPGWLVLPGLYFGTYYAFFVWSRVAALRIARAFAAFNAGKAMRHDPEHRDPVFVRGKGNMHIQPYSLLPLYALGRVFEKGRVHFIGTSEACERAAGAEARASDVRYEGSYPIRGPDLISAPGEPDKPVLRIDSESTAERLHGVRLQVTQYSLTDEATGETRALRLAHIAFPAVFPMPIVGFALNSGAPKWQGFAGFARSKSRPLACLGQGEHALPPRDFLARAMMLTPSTDMASRAVGEEAVAAIIDAADLMLTRMDLTILEEMLADPLRRKKGEWLRHLKARPAVVGPYASRIFAALALLKGSNGGTSQIREELWGLAAVLPDADLALHWPTVLEWLDPAGAGSSRLGATAMYRRLDAADPREREILLHQLESTSSLDTSLLESFCRMGSAAPEEVKERLLAIWNARKPDPNRGNGERNGTDAVLYFTLARLGLKERVGKVVQRQHGTTFAGIWREVDADTHPELCGASTNDLTNRLRER